MFTIIVPFHSDYFRLRTTIPSIVEGSKLWPIGEVLLCHNGPALSQKQMDELNLFLPKDSKFKLLHTDEAGVGAGYQLGLQHATQKYVILTASDLPFGFSDLEAFLRISPPPEYALGSKAHPESQARNRTWIRLLATATFKYLRKILLGPSTPDDSQGTHIVSTELAQKLARQCIYKNYLFQLEMPTLHLSQNGKCVELPVKLAPEIYPTNIRLFRDSWNMLKGICALAWRFR